MTRPENTIIKEPGNRFHGQPAWTEDMYHNYSVPGDGPGPATVDYMRITQEFRERHSFPPEAYGLALRTHFDGDRATTRSPGR